MSTWREQWKTLSDKVSNFSTRERGLMLLAGTALLSWSLYDFWLLPQQEQWDREQLRIEQMGRDIQAAQLEIDVLRIKLAKDPDQDVREQLALLAQRLQELSNQLKAQTIDLIPAEEMPSALHSLLAQGHNLHIEGIKSIPPTPLLPAQQQPNLYRHEIQMEFSGGYFDVYRYLRALENLPRHFYWRHFDYRVDQWPRATVLLTVYTLSSSKEFIRG
ncbi:MSHA biogenesis protein MshJ [Aeromonas simiae]|uniref:MSHA biogenesis protein MshJ n=1 Tax=Aeromonas simiae TaxID=218936 RepID=UPI00266CAE2C|nr:MSHA biogenesis protein MshJ [Aeromonas simiae]MDO2947636.1 type 4a pilus biogenesis protein PilO [Aeromonas simiae]MDO2953028.1 type 4a pilus biogenesis protein PilO [Aeromonas simiae]MDO2954851.1 type 4a pilus biogenesis protein PilO [Aeromonas simiae]